MKDFDPNSDMARLTRSHERFASAVKALRRHLDEIEDGMDLDALSVPSLSHEIMGTVTAAHAMLGMTASNVRNRKPRA